MDIEEINKRVIYDPLTGIFTWSKSWPGVKAGGECGSITKAASGIRYRLLKINRRQYYAHRVAIAIITGKEPLGEVDHINGDGLDNRYENLRDVDKSSNQKNKRIASNNKTGLYGVSLDLRVGRKPMWRAYINIDGKTKSLIRTSDFFEACCARKSAENKNGYSFRHGEPKKPS